MFTYRIDEGLALRILDVGDKEEVFKLTDEARSYLREWLPWVDRVKEVSDTEEFIKMTKKGFAENQSLNAAIVYQGEVVGVAGYNLLDWTNHIAHIGYWLGEGHQGKGIMTRVARALTDYAIFNLMMNKVEIRAAEGNVKSRAVPERLGYVEEGRIRAGECLYGEYVNHVVYGVLAEEWKN
ncbi:GNAT family N-acetyltransferase [Alkalibacillus aidingensis]|uniref:GNAT family N-acetyltransferase n=1 Tax=Alkalibacillus aidingensis TaxID=2747607 RepID=UPI00166033F5|nr:GNAT family protein [Alkalibacillus aidingensis]